MLQYSNCALSVSWLLLRLTTVGVDPSVTYLHPVESSNETEVYHVLRLSNLRCRRGYRAWSTAAQQWVDAWCSERLYSFSAGTIVWVTNLGVRQF